MAQDSGCHIEIQNGGIKLRDPDCYHTNMGIISLLKKHCDALPPPPPPPPPPRLAMKNLSGSCTLKLVHVNETFYQCDPSIHRPYIDDSKHTFCVNTGPAGTRRHTPCTGRAGLRV